MRINTLYGKILGTFIIFVLIAELAAFAVQSLRHYSDQKAGLIRNLDELIVVQSANLAPTVWEYDIDGMKNITQRISRLPYVQGVLISDDTGGLLVGEGAYQQSPKMPAYRKTAQVVYKNGGVNKVVGHMTVTVHDQHIFSSLIDFAYFNGLILLSLLVALIGATFISIKLFIGRPVNLLKKAIEQEKVDHVGRRVDWESSDELGVVVKAFNSMQDDRDVAAREIERYQSDLENLVEERTGKLAEKEKILSLALNNMTDGMYMLDGDMRYVLFNERYRNFVGFGEDLVHDGGLMKNVVQAHAERGDYGEGDIPSIVQQRMDTLANGESGNVEMVFGGSIQADVRKESIDDGGVVVTVSDITVRKQTEARLQDAFGVITSSIEYASRIQRSIFPDDSILSTVSKDHFILWEPRDTVGGDIYWVGSWGDGCLVILGDCTGHGVPGAFMTLISIGALERALSEIEGGNVAQLVSRTHQYIQAALSQNYEGGDSDDGIELGACYFVPGGQEITFVGARFELIINEGDDITIIKGTKKGMGYRGIPYEQGYDERTVHLKAGQSFYLTTDGLIDQVGGERKRTFGKKRLKVLLAHIYDKPMSEQKEAIYQTLLDYQGDEIRRDDVSLIGFRL